MKLDDNTKDLILQLKSKGLSSRKIASIAGVGKSTVNELFKREGLAVKQHKAPKVLLFDLESSPSIVATFGRFNVNIGPESVVREGGIILSACWKWLGDSTVHKAVLTPEEAVKDDDSRIVAMLYDAFENSDAVLGHNAAQFDVPLFKARLIANGFPPARKVKVIDTLKIAKGLKFNSNKLDSLGNYLNVGRKKVTTGMSLWLRCIQGDAKALQEMLEYNEQDVILLEKVYNKLKAFQNNPVNAGHWHDDDKVHCPVCGSTNLSVTGNEVIAGASKFSEVQCNDCGHRSRTRVALTSKEQRANLLAS